MSHMEDAQKPETKKNEVDEALDETFPASDPPSYNPGHAGNPSDKKKKPKAEKPDEEDVDEAIEETFPASDPPSFTPGTA